MNFATLPKCVLCSYQAANDWAVLVAAVRAGDDRYIVPFIFASQDSPIFSQCGRALFWARQGLLHEMRTRNLSASQGQALIADALEYTVNGIQSQAQILEYIKNPGPTESFLKRLLSSGDKLENFTLGDEPAYRWLVEKTEAAFRVHATIRHLVRKHNLHALSQYEQEEKATRAMLKGAGARQVY